MYFEKFKCAPAVVSHMEASIEKLDRKVIRLGYKVGFLESLVYQNSEV